MTRAGSAVLCCATLVCCSSPVPNIVRYDLSPRTEVQRPGARRDAPMITVKRFEAAAPYFTDQMALRTSPLRLDYYRYHQWIAPIPDLVTDLVIERWRTSGKFSRIERNHGGRGTDLVVEGRIQVFEFDATDPRAPAARIAIEFSARAPGGAPLFRREFRDRVALSAPSMDGIAAALGEGTIRVAARVEATLLRAARAARATKMRKSSH